MLRFNYNNHREHGPGRVMNSRKMSKHFGLKKVGKLFGRAHRLQLCKSSHARDIKHLDYLSLSGLSIQDDVSWMEFRMGFRR